MQKSQRCACSHIILSLILTASFIIISCDSGVDPDEDPGTGPGKFFNTGNYEIIHEAGGPENGFQVFRPALLGQIKHPVIAWANATSAEPDSYQEFLEHLASHGFIVIASNSTMTMSERFCEQGIQWVIDESNRTGSIYYNNVDTEATGVTGHSQGGSAAIIAGENSSLVKTIVPIAPGPFHNPTNVHVSSFFIAGESDPVCPPESVKSQFDMAPSLQKIYGVINGYSHLSFVHSLGEARGYVTAWFYAELMDDPFGKSVFYGDDCIISLDKDWEIDKYGI